MFSSKLCAGTQILHVLHAVHAGFPASTSKFHSKTALPHLTQFLHNATFEIQNSKFNPNDQLHSCAAYLNSPFLPSSLLSGISSLKLTFTKDNSGHNLGNLNGALFDLLMRTEKGMDRMILLDSSQGMKAPELPGNIKLLPLR